MATATAAAVAAMRAGRMAATNAPLAPKGTGSATAEVPATGPMPTEVACAKTLPMQAPHTGAQPTGVPHTGALPTEVPHMGAQPKEVPHTGALPTEVPPTETQPIRITRLHVRNDRVVADIALAPSAPRYTSPELVAHVLSAYPNLPKHSCVNERGTTFALVMNNTPVPHLLEHMVVDLQVRAAQQERAAQQGRAAQMQQDRPETRQVRAAQQKPTPSTSLGIVTGTSEWVSEQNGRARIAVSFADDLVALAAFKEAVGFLNDALAG